MLESKHINETIQGLNYTMEMIVFDPLTGNIKNPIELNDADRITYDACGEAIDLLNDYENTMKPVRAVFIDRRCYCGHCGNLIYKVIGEYNFCSRCGKAVDWSHE